MLGRIYEMMAPGLKPALFRGSFGSHVSIFSNSDERLGLYFPCCKFNYSVSESALYQTERPLSLTWSFLLHVCTKALRRPWAAGWHLPSHLDSELLLQRIFPSPPECSEMPRALLSNMAATSYTQLFKFKFKLVEIKLILNIGLHSH